MHKSKSKYYNNGIFFQSIINEYENKYNYFKNKDNEIDIKLKIDENGYLHSHDNLKELNELLLLLIFKQIMCYYIEKYKIFYFA